MLTRIISSAVLIAIAVGLVVLNMFFPITAVIAVSVLSAMATYEMLKNTGAVKPKALYLGCSAFAALICAFSLLNVKAIPLVVALFIVFVATLSLVYHKKAPFSAVFASLAAPLTLGFAFSRVGMLLGVELFYFLLLLNFACICDCGAYFAGVTLGKHKLCPEISPKKTVEGAVGGIVSSLIVTVVLVLCFNKKADLWPLLAATPVMCVVGMLGDLFASVIKRSVGIKDYSNLIPGHGGIMDRFDSILLIAPLFTAVLSLIGVL